MQRFFLLLFSILLVVSCKQKPMVKKMDASLKINKQHNIQLASGTLQRIDSFPSKYIQPRPVDIWLPNDYSKNEKYAVLYMHDGQMLFDATTTWNKQEWKVDEWAGKLQKEEKTKPFIVVAIHNISKIRWNDYFPAKAMNYVSETDKKKITSLAKKNNFNTDLNANAYLKFITQEVKPFIDKAYSVYTTPENTFVMGSSMGGLISMYAIGEYPMVFGGAACISTHWPGAGVSKENPLPEAIFSYAKEHLPNAKNHRLYFDYGTETLDQYYPQYASKVDEIFADKGYDASNFINQKFEGADHSENSWNQRLDIPLTFLLGK